MANYSKGRLSSPLDHESVVSPCLSASYPSYERRLLKQLRCLANPSVANQTICHVAGERVKLDEKLSEELIKESTRSEVESHLEKAIECQKRRGRVRDYSDLVKVGSTLPYISHHLSSYLKAGNLLGEACMSNHRIQDNFLAAAIKLQLWMPSRA